MAINHTLDYDEGQGPLEGLDVAVEPTLCIPPRMVRRDQGGSTDFVPRCGVKARLGKLDFFLLGVYNFEYGSPACLNAMCSEWGEELGQDAWITLGDNKGALCLSCAGLEHLPFVPSGDAALTRRARKHSTLSGVLLNWSGARTRSERQGLLVEAQGLEQAEQERFADSEVRSLAIYAGMSGGVLMTSDALDELSAERLKLWKLLLSSNGATCRLPLLGDSAITYKRRPADPHSGRVCHESLTDPVLVQVRGNEQMSVIFVFNTGESTVQRTYPLAALGLHAPQHIFDWTSQTTSAAPSSSLSVTLAPHDGALLFVSPSPITSAPEQLP